MRRIALYSDVHANLVAFSAVSEDIAAAGLEERYCLGDVVGLGPRPEECIELLQDLGDGAIQGGYDRAIAMHMTTPENKDRTAQEELDEAESYAFTVSRLSKASADYLRALPHDVCISESGISIVLCHGSPRLIYEIVPPDAPPGRILQLAEQAGADVVCCGHTHVPFHRSVPWARGVVHWVNVGSVGRPRDGDVRAAWVELVIGARDEVVANTPTDLACRRIGDSELWLGAAVHRVAYDVDSVIRDMDAMGLPHTLAVGLRNAREAHDMRRENGEPAKSPEGPARQLLACGHETSACTCMFDDRVAAYEALARIYRADIAEVSAAVRRLRTVMRGSKVNPKIDEAAILRAFEDADAALRTAAGRTAFEDERERLYGLQQGFDPFANVLSPEESTYLAGEPGVQSASLQDIYDEACFTMPDIAGHPVPAHIATELSFMAHCLRGVAAGDPKALDRARHFFAQHLGQWAVLFAVVVARQAAEPVMRYAGLALDKHLMCESVMFRQELPEHDGLRSGASSDDLH